ncbi:glutamate synthase domain-containing protein 2 [Catenulispora sp. GAS73]
MALLNVSGMSFGALSGNALRALNIAAAAGHFAHDTGEGGISKYHRQGGDLIWELGTGKCHTNQCPVSVATQDPKRSRALDVADKAERVRRFQQGTVAEAQQIVASMGLTGPDQLRPRHIWRRVDQSTIGTLADLYPWLDEGQLIHEPPEDWYEDWRAADPDTFSV